MTIPDCHPGAACRADDPSPAFAHFPSGPLRAIIFAGTGLSFAGWLLMGRWDGRLVIPSGSLLTGCLAYGASYDALPNAQQQFTHCRPHRAAPHRRFVSLWLRATA